MNRSDVLGRKWDEYSEEDKYRLWSLYYVNSVNPSPLGYASWCDLMEAANSPVE